MNRHGVETALDKRYGSGVSSLSPLFAGMTSPPSAAQCIQPEPGYGGPLSFAACSWWLTASLPTGPQRKNRWLMFLGSPGAWFQSSGNTGKLKLVPLKRTLGHLLSSPARRIARSLVGLPPDGANEAQSVFTLNSHREGIRRGKE